MIHNPAQEYKPVNKRDVRGGYLLTIEALWLIGTQNITYKIQVNGKGFTYYVEHIL